MNPHVKKYLSVNGAKGGAAGTGAVKARPSHVARRAAKIGQTMRHLKPGYRLCDKCGGSGQIEQTEKLTAAGIKISAMEVQ